MICGVVLAVSAIVVGFSVEGVIFLGLSWLTGISAGRLFIQGRQELRDQRIQRLVRAEGAQLRVFLEMASDAPSPFFLLNGTLQPWTKIVESAEEYMRIRQIKVDRQTLIRVIILAFQDPVEPAA